MTIIKIKNVSYILKHPTRLDRYKALELYKDTIYFNRYENWYNKKTILNGNIASRSQITFYTRFGDLIARWAILFTIILLLISISGRLKKK